MRVLIAAFGSRGDVQPMLALALALKHRGHTVRVCTPPDYGEWIGQLQLQWQTSGGSMHEFVKRSSEGLRGIRYAGRALPELIGGQYAVLEPLARECDVMLGSTLTAAGASFAEKFSIRYHYVAFTPCVIPSAEYPSLFTKSQMLPRWLNRLSWWLSKVANNAGLKGVINTQRRRLELPPITDAWRHLLHEKIFVASDPALAPLAGDAPGGTTQLGGFIFPESETLSPELEEFLAAGAPPVYVGFGSMPDGDPAATTRWVLDAIRKAGVRALISRGASGLGDSEPPPGVFALGAAPHGKLFPRCAGVIHHGGAGTTATAARAGIPQVIVPHMTDQFFWRRRLEERSLMPAHVRRGDGDSLAAAMRACVDDSALRDRARAFAATMISDGLKRAVEQLENGAAQC